MAGVYEGVGGVMEDLKPCPFCGEVPKGIHCASGETYNYSIVSCSTRGCRGDNDLWSDGHSIIQAIAAWNTRA